MTVSLVVLLGVFKLSVNTLCAIALNVLMLSAVMLSVNMRNVMAPVSVPV